MLLDSAILARRNKRPHPWKSEVTELARPWALAVPPGPGRGYGQAGCPGCPQHLPCGSLLLPTDLEFFFLLFIKSPLYKVAQMMTVSFKWWCCIRGDCQHSSQFWNFWFCEILWFLIHIFKRSHFTGISGIVNWSNKLWALNLIDGGESFSCFTFFSMISEK